MRNGVKRSQAVLEQVAVLVIVVGALLWMKGWIQNSLQGKMKASADQMGSQFDPTRTSAVHLTTSTVTSIEHEDKIITISNSQELDKQYTPGANAKQKPTN